MKKVLVVDLDKTLLKIDTFKSYILYVGIAALKVFRVDICFVLTTFTLLRKLRLISHSTLKYHVLQKSKYFMNDQRLSSFVSTILREANANVLDAMRKYKAQGYFTLLSTAAPISYATKIKDFYEFDAVCATTLPDEGKEWEENVRERKRDITLKFLQGKDMVLDTFVTDHYDDLPLLQVEKVRNILVAPSAKTQDIIELHNIKYEII